MKNLELIKTTARLRVLVVEDDPDDLFLIQEMLTRITPQGPAGQPVQLAHATRIEDAERIALDQEINLILLDLSLPDSHGLESLRRMREAAPAIPIVVLSGMDDEGMALEAVRCGAQDYLVKGRVGLKILYRVMRYAIERKQVETEIRRLNENLEARVRERTSKLEESYRDLEREIAERRLAEERLRRSERLLAQAQQIAHLGSWEWDIRDDRVQWSEEMFRIFGVGVEEFGANYEAVLHQIHAEDRSLVHSAIAECYETRRPFEIHHRVLRNDGKTRHIHSRGEVILDELGNPARMIGTSQDITEIKTAEIDLNEKNRLLRLLHRVSLATNESNSVESAMTAAVRLMTQNFGFAFGRAMWFAEKGTAIGGKILYAPARTRYEALAGVLAAETGSPATGLHSRVLASGKPEWSLDLAADKSFPYRSNAEAAKIRSGLAFPVLTGGNVTGLLDFYSEGALHPSGAVLDAANQVGVHLGFVVERFRLKPTGAEKDRLAARRENTPA